MKKYLIVVALVLFFAAGAFTVLNLNTKGPSKAVSGTQVKSGTILFTRSDCIHCQKVEAFLNDNKVADKVKYDILEIHDANNASLYEQKANECSLQKPWGVPMLYDDGKCISGDQPIIDFFKNKIK